MMDKASFMYVALFLNIIIMFYVLYNIWNTSNYKKNKKWFYTYFTIIFPIFGFLLTLIDRKKMKSSF